ncbi:hypothetical protein I5M27_10335 [Adhaeribacter sp. BT258]|uniref:Secreted protein n=1 Tax=Adhaeribacter terrigena TaxID=2793070 RepID=A0ABS1C1V9_9BACT|nr:hypothetical protein [Adhaeribacter terrigena]
MLRFRIKVPVKLYCKILTALLNISVGVAVPASRSYCISSKLSGIVRLSFILMEYSLVPSGENSSPIWSAVSGRTPLYVIKPVVALKFNKNIPLLPPPAASVNARVLPSGDILMEVPFPALKRE